MDKKLIGWTVVVSTANGDIRSYFNINQPEAMQSCLLTYVMEGLHTIVVEPEYGFPRKVLY